MMGEAVPGHWCGHVAAMARAQPWCLLPKVTSHGALCVLPPSPQLLEKHKAMESMVELLEMYQEEDEAYGDLAEATTQL